MKTKVDLSLLLTKKCKSYDPSLHIVSDPLDGSAVSGGGWIVVSLVTKDTLSEISDHEREAITEGGHHGGRPLVPSQAALWLV